MIDKCANPQCAEDLTYLRSGILYAVDGPRTSIDQGYRRRFFWLCGTCSRRHKLHFNEHGDPYVVPADAPNPPYDSSPEHRQVQHIFIGACITPSSISAVGEDMRLMPPYLPA